MMWGQVEVFQGRLYVTRGRFTTGVAVEGEPLGDVILRLCALPSDAYRDSWETFCEDVAGVPPRRYHPEKSARVYLDDGMWHACADPFGPEEAMPATAADLAHDLGAMVRRVLDAAEPQWPAIRQVAVMTSATGGLVVMPVVSGALAGPARTDDPSLPAAVRAALPESDRKRGEGPGYADALAAAGVDGRLLDGCAAVRIEELSTGAIRLTGTGSAALRPATKRTWLGSAGDLDEVCAEVLRMIAELPVEHLPPGTPAGAAFGYKRTWLAVRGSTVEQVADAIGLTGGREAGWDEGVRTAVGEQIFVSPPIGGWIFVVNAAQAFDGSSVASLSARLGTEVQYFGNHRVASYAEWALAVDGRLVRRVLCNEAVEACQETGTPTPVEIEIGFSAAEPGGRWADEDDVMRVAASWSIDPNALSVIESSPRPGLVGRHA